MKAISEFTNRMKLSDFLLSAAKVCRRLGERESEAFLLKMAAEQYVLVKRIESEATREAKSEDPVRLEEFNSVLKRHKEKERIKQKRQKKSDPKPIEMR